jgi:hypothetical protein
MVVPGPKVALIVANSVAYGTRCGLLTVVGTIAAMVPQLALAAFGLVALLGTLAECSNDCRGSASRILSISASEPRGRRSRRTIPPLRLRGRHCCV